MLPEIGAPLEERLGRHGEELRFVLGAVLFERLDSPALVDLLAEGLVSREKRVHPAFALDPRLGVAQRRPVDRVEQVELVGELLAVAGVGGNGQAVGGHRHHFALRFQQCLETPQHGLVPISQ